MILLQNSFHLTLSTLQLLFFGIAGITAGFLLKFIIEKFFLKSKADKDIENEYQTNIDALQNKFSAEIIKKEEETKLLQEELKDAEEKNYNVQLQYSKVLKQIESQKQYPAPAYSTADQGNVYEEILDTLNERIALQEKTINDLQQHSQDINDARNSNSYNSNNNEDNEILLKELQNKIGLLQAEKEKSMLDADALIAAHNTAKDELLQTTQSHKEALYKIEIAFTEKLANAETKAEQYRQQTEELRNNMYSGVETFKNSHRESSENIKNIRSDVERMNDVINNFKEHLSTTLETSYPYEQAISENEALKEKLLALHDDKIKMDENTCEQLNKINEEKNELEIKCAEMTREMLHAQRLVEQLEDERNTAFLSLQEVSKEKETALYDLEMTIGKLRKNIEILQTDLQQKDNFLQEVSARESKYKEMFYAVKDLESQFLSLYPQLDKTEEETFIVNNNGQIR